MWDPCSLQFFNFFSFDVGPILATVRVGPGTLAPYKPSIDFMQAAF